METNRRVSAGISDEFATLVDKISSIGFYLHKDALIAHALANLIDTRRSITQLKLLTGDKALSALVVSAGPSLHRRDSIRKVKASGYNGTIIASDGSYIACLKQGLIPDFVITLDPHPRRIVRWFGDPEFVENMAGDDYFARQDLDVEFRKNSEVQNQAHIELVNLYGSRTRAVVSSSAPRNVVARLKSAGFEMYWWNPLVDDPLLQASISRKLYDINRMPCVNTGGTVGTAAWVFANSFLNIPEIGLLGMDLGYYADTPLEKTQTFYELHQQISHTGRIEAMFVDFEFPLTGQKFYTDPTYFWYRKNFLELLALSKNRTINCTEGGTLFADNLPCETLDGFLARNS